MFSARCTLGGFVGQLALPLVFSKPLSAIEVAETWNAVRSPYATVTEPAVISTLAGAEEGLSGGGSGGGGGGSGGACCQQQTFDFACLYDEWTLRLLCVYCMCMCIVLFNCSLIQAAVMVVVAMVV